MPNEEHVDFVPKAGVTLYVGGGSFSHDPDNPARIPKSVADAWEEHRHKPDAAAPKVKAKADKPEAATQP